MRDVQLIFPSRQREWGLFAVANFIIGGAGTGFYSITFATQLIEGHLTKQHAIIPYDILSISIVALGLLCVAVETGHPFRGYYIFSRPVKSWISREVIAFAVFVLVVLLNHFSQHWIFNIIAVVSSLCFMIIQGFIVYSARAVTLWNTGLMPLIFLSSGLASGAGVSLLFTLSNRLLVGGLLLRLSFLCVAFNLALWLFYLRWYSVVPLQTAAETPELKQRFFKKFLIIIFCHIIPILLLLLIWQIRVQPKVEGNLSDILVAASGLVIIIGVSVQKSWIVISAGYIGKVDLKY